MGWGWARSWGRIQLGQLAQINQRDILYRVASDINTMERRRKHLLFTVFDFWSE